MKKLLIAMIALLLVPSCIDSTPAAGVNGGNAQSIVLKIIEMQDIEGLEKLWDSVTWDGKPPPGMKEQRPPCMIHIGSVNISPSIKDGGTGRNAAVANKPQSDEEKAKQ